MRRLQSPGEPLLGVGRAGGEEVAECGVGEEVGERLEEELLVPRLVVAWEGGSVVAWELGVGWELGAGVLEGFALGVG